MLRGGVIPESSTKSSSDDLNDATSSSHDREDSTTAALDKVTKITYATNIRIVYIPRKENIDLAEQIEDLKKTISSYDGFSVIFFYAYASTSYVSFFFYRLA